jgi:AAHS family 4-hydroxybenzoate transporter-like MFS transporter
MTLLWLPAILNAAGGTPSQAVFGATLFALAGILGAFLLARPITRFGSEQTLCLALLAGAVATFIAGSMPPSYQTLLILIFCMGFGISGSQMGMNALAGSAYPSEIRSTGAGWALGVGRLGNVLGPLIGGMLLQRGFQAQSIFLAASIPVLIAAIAMLALGIWRKRVLPTLPAGVTAAAEGCT